MSDLVASEKMTQTVAQNGHRLRYSTESAGLSVSNLGEQRADFKFGADSIRTVDRIMVISPPKPNRKLCQMKLGINKIEI
jgi:hypothetical protein